MKRRNTSMRSVVEITAAHPSAWEHVRIRWVTEDLDGACSPTTLPEYVILVHRIHFTEFQRRRKPLKQAREGLLLYPIQCVHQSPTIQTRGHELVLNILRNVSFCKCLTVHINEAGTDVRENPYLYENWLQAKQPQ